jgi:hypothetical protein
MPPGFDRERVAKPAIDRSPYRRRHHTNHLSGSNPDHTPLNDHRQLTHDRRPRRARN